MLQPGSLDLEEENKTLKGRKTGIEARMVPHSFFPLKYQDLIRRHSSKVTSRKGLQNADSLKASPIIYLAERIPN